MTKKKVKKAWEFNANQTFEIGKKKYFIHDCLRFSKDLEVNELKLSEMYTEYNAPGDGTLRSFVQHIKMVNEADLSYPILINENGCIIDGRHRLAKALLNGEKTIKAVRFKEDPEEGFDWV